MVAAKTNMSEFAFSGVGSNPHYGTPGNPFDRARVPATTAAIAAAFADAGYGAPHIFTVHPSQGARRDA